jgi:radical SAM enzyme (TIGR01210 family)
VIAGAVSDYPSNSRQRTEWIRGRRGPRQTLDPHRPYACLVEEECTAAGDIASTATIFLTNRECPWTCLMCDLWRNTLTESVPIGAIPRQIDFALKSLPEARQVKLYNAGSFFDPRAIPPADFPAIARRLESFERVIVECHPALVNDSVLRFRDLLAGKLEVAMGLETAHSAVLEKLNKGLTLDRFKAAAAFLQRHDIALRTFVLVQPPFLPVAESLEWAQRSVEFSFDAGAKVVALIPTRMGNGALDTLARRGEFSEPKLSSLEAAVDTAMALGRGRILADLWDLHRFSTCPHCFPTRRDRLHQMNLRKMSIPPVRCPAWDR